MEKKIISQNSLVLDYIREHGGITNTDAFKYLGITRLANNICDLRNKGVAIGDSWEESPNRYGKVCRYKRYFLNEDGKKVGA